MNSGFKKAGAALAASAILLSAYSVEPTAVRAETDIKYELYLDSNELISGSTVVDKGLAYLPLKTIAEQLGANVVQNGNRITVRGKVYSFAIRIGSNTAVLNGKSTRMKGSPWTRNEEVFVPAKFLVDALKGTGLKYEPEVKTIVASDIYSGHNKSHYGGLNYRISSDGKLSATNSEGVTKQLYDFETETYNPHNFEFTKTNQGLLILRITDIYGEPMVQQHVFTVIMKNGAVIRQSKVNYFKRFANNAAVSVNGKELVLTDGIKLRILEDHTGSVKETYDLIELGGVEGKYAVEAVEDDFLLIRSNTKGLLTYIDRRTRERIVLYKELLPLEEQQYAENNDVPYYGDEIYFLRRTEQNLEFKITEELSGKQYTKSLNISSL